MPKHVGVEVFSKEDKIQRYRFKLALFVLARECKTKCDADPFDRVCKEIDSCTFGLL